MDFNKVHVEVIVDEEKPFESTVSSIGKIKTVKCKGDLSKCNLSKSSRSTSILIAEKQVDDLIVKMKDVRHENISKVIVPIKPQWTAPDRSNINTTCFHGDGWGNRVQSNSNMKPVDSIQRHNNIKGTGWGNHSASTSASTSNLAPDKFTPASTNVTKDRYSNKNNYDSSYQNSQNVNFQSRNDPRDCNMSYSKKDNDIRFSACSNNND